MKSSQVENLSYLVNKIRQYSTTQNYKKQIAKLKFLKLKFLILYLTVYIYIFSYLHVISPDLEVYITFVGLEAILAVAWAHKALLEEPAGWGDKTRQRNRDLQKGNLSVAMVTIDT